MGGKPPMSGDVSLYFNLLSRDRATPAIQKSAAAVRAANMSAAASTAVMGAAMASAGAWAISLGAAVSAGIGSIPAIAAGAAASIIGLKLATGGLGAAWKALGQSTASGGGSAASTARQVAAAQREVASASEALSRANKQLAAAQQAVNDSQEIAVKNLRDLNLNLADAQLSEQAAVLGLADARQALAQARMSGDSSQIAHATLGYKEAQLAILQARARTDDLTEAQQKAAAAGIQGSEAVTSAQEQYLTATQAVADATQRLADAQANLKTAGSGGGGGGSNAAAEAMAKLAPSAREVVLALKAMGPEWRKVQQSVQQETFRGVAGDLKNLSSAVLPTVSAQMKRMGQSFNLGIRQTLKLASSSKSVGSLNTILTSTNQAVDKIARSLAPFVDGFLTLGAAGSSILPQIAGWVQQLAVDFQNWANAASSSGRLATWLGQGRDALQALWTTARNVLGIIGAIFKAGGADSGVGFLQKLAEMTTRLREFLNTAQGQAAVNRVLDDLRSILGGITDLLPAVAGHAGEFTDTLKVSAPIMHELAQHADTLAKLLPWIAAGYVLAKAAGLLHLGVLIAQLPVMAAHATANRFLAREMKAVRVAQQEQNAAMIQGEVIQKRSIIAMIASKIATVAQAVASGIATAAQWLWNIAQMANPTMLIVIAIIALIAIFVLLWVKCSWFRDFWIGLWHILADSALWLWHKVLEPYFMWIIGNYIMLWNFLKAVGAWFAGPFVDFFVHAYQWLKDKATDAANWVTSKFQGMLNFFINLPGRIKSAVSGLWDALINVTRGAFNKVIGLWNSLDFALSIKVPDWVPGVGGKGFSVSDIFPDLPYLASGGLIARAGLAMVGEKGPEVVSLPEGAQVHRSGTGPSSGPTQIVLRIDSAGSRMDDAIVELIRRAVRAQGGDLAVLGLKAA
jgi:hypothetical protein